MVIVVKTPVIVDKYYFSKGRVIGLLLLVLKELLFMKIAIVVICPVICLTTDPKYQLSDVATVEQVTEDLEEELAQECILFVLDWHSMMMVSYLLLGCLLIHVLPLVSVRIHIRSRTFGNF